MDPKGVPADHAQEELQQIAAWLKGEGLEADAPVEARLRALWGARLHARSQLAAAMQDLDGRRLRHAAEMAEVRRSLEQIRRFNEHQKVLAQEIQDENEQLKEQLRRLVALQDAQVSEVAKMLYQQGLTELVHSGPSEQVAYLLVERASLLETRGGPDGRWGTQGQGQGTPRASRSPWRRLFGLKAPQSKPAPQPAEAAVRDQSGLEKDLEEGSRRLALAHGEIRRLREQLESAHLTQKTYEPELQEAHQEVEKLQWEVEQLKTYETAELRKAEILNHSLELELRALRSRLPALEARRSSPQRTVISTEEVQGDCIEEEEEGGGGGGEGGDDEDGQNRLLTFRVVTPADQDEEEGDPNVSEVRRQMPPDQVSTEEKQTQTGLRKEDTRPQECLQDAARGLLDARAQCEELQEEICETLKRLDKERSRFHQKKQRQRAQLSRAWTRFDAETRRRDEKIRQLERELSLCCHSLAKEKELVAVVTLENEKLLVERRRLLRRLCEEESCAQNLDLGGSSSRCRS